MGNTGANQSVLFDGGDNKNLKRYGLQVGGSGGLDPLGFSDDVSNLQWIDGSSHAVDSSTNMNVLLTQFLFLF